MRIEPIDRIPVAGDYTPEWDEWRIHTDKTPHSGYQSLIRAFMAGDNGAIVEVIYDTDTAPQQTICSGLRSARLKMGAPVDVVLRGARVFLRQHPYDRAALRRSVVTTLEDFVSDLNENLSLTVDYGDQTRAAHNAFNYQRKVLRLGQVHIAMRGGLIVLTKDL